MSGFLKLSGSVSSPGSGTGSAADGYVAFFTGTSTIAGDNDLFWNRETNELILGKNISVAGQVYSPTLTTSTPTGTTQTINFDFGANHILDLESATGDVTLSFSNPKPGATYTLLILQDSAVARDIVWPGNLKWADGVIPTISAGNNSEDIVQMWYNGTSYYATIVQNFS
jgi:hypothetical protein